MAETQFYLFRPLFLSLLAMQLADNGDVDDIDALADMVMGGPIEC